LFYIDHVTTSNNAHEKILKRNAWTVALVATIVLLTSVCGIGYRSRPHPELPPPARVALAQTLSTPVALSPDGRKVLSWDTQFLKLKVFDVFDHNTPVVLNSAGCGSQVPEAQFSWDGKQVVGKCGFSDLTVWNSITGEAVNRLPCGVAPYLPAWSHDAHFLAAVCKIREIKVWELPSGKEISAFESPGAFGSQLAFTPQGQLILTGNDGSLRLADISGHILRSHDFGDFVRDFVLRSDGKEVVVVTTNHYGHNVKGYIWDLNSDTHRVVHELDTPAAKLIALSPDGSFLILNTGAEAAVFSLRQSRYIQNLGGGIKAAVFTTDGRIIAITTFSTVQIWRIQGS
jgi:WD40 repeat protein